VEHSGQRLTRVLRVEAHDLRSARESRDECRLDQPLQIDRDIVARASNDTDRTDERLALVRTAPVFDRQPMIDGWHEIQDFVMLPAPQPVDPRGGICATKRRRYRDRVDDVAERTEADDQETSHLVNETSEFRLPIAD